MYPSDNEDYDEEEREQNAAVQSMLPFAVVGSTKVYDVNGVPVRGRQTRDSLINIEDPAHCEFVQLRDYLLRMNLHDLIDTTTFTYYESFRSKQLLALKESSAKQHAQHAHMPQASPAAASGTQYA